MPIKRPNSSSIWRYINEIARNVGHKTIEIRISSRDRSWNCITLY